jgi:hypothetical protein
LNFVVVEELTIFQEASKMKRVLLIPFILILMSLWPAKAIGDVIVNPSFEDSLNGWGTYHDPGMNRYPEDTFATDGQYNLQLFDQRQLFLPFNDN